MIATGLSRRAVLQPSAREGREWSMPTCAAPGLRLDVHASRTQATGLACLLDRRSRPATLSASASHARSVPRMLTRMAVGCDGGTQSWPEMALLYWKFGRALCEAGGPVERHLDQSCR